MARRELTGWRTEHAARLAGHVLHPLLRIDNLPPRHFVGCFGQKDVIDRVSADLKALRQLADLGPVERRSRRTVLRNVDRGGQAVLRQEVRNAKVQGVAVVPASGDTEAGGSGLGNADRFASAMRI